MKKINSLSDYQKAKKKRKITNIIIQLSILVIFFGGWEMLANFNIINEFLISKPSAIYNLFITYIASGQLMNHIGISVYETLLGLIIGTVLGFIIATILYLSDRLAQILDPYLVVLNALPKTALAPILIIWAGTGVRGIVVVSISLSIVITIISCYSYFKNIDESLIKMMKTFNATKLQILFKVIYPANIANLLSVIKINIGLAWIGVIVGEFLVSRSGIGYLVVYGGQVFRLDLVMMGVIILSIIALLMYEIVNLIEYYFRRKKTHKKRLDK